MQLLHAAAELAAAATFPLCHCPPPHSLLS